MIGRYRKLACERHGWPLERRFRQKTENAFRDDLEWFNALPEHDWRRSNATIVRIYIPEYHIRSTVVEAERVAP